MEEEKERKEKEKIETQKKEAEDTIRSKGSHGAEEKKSSNSIEAALFKGVNRLPPIVAQSEGSDSEAYWKEVEENNKSICGDLKMDPEQEQEIDIRSGVFENMLKKLEKKG